MRSLVFPPRARRDPCPLGFSARDFFTNILICFPSNVGEQAEVANLLRLYVTDTIRESTLRAHTVGATQDEPMPQSSTKRGQEEAGDTEDTATYPGQSDVPVDEEPPPPPTRPPGDHSHGNPDPNTATTQGGGTHRLPRPTHVPIA